MDRDKVRRSPTLELVALVEEARARGEDAFSLSTPSFPERLPPLQLMPHWGKLTDAAGLPALREQARPLLFSRWRAPDHRMIVTGGAKAAIFAVLRAVVPPGSTILVVAPFWPSYEDLAAAATLNMRTIQTDLASGFAIPIDEVERQIKLTGARAILLSNPNNPSGKVYTRDEIEALADMARRHALTLVLDESFSELVYDRAHWTESAIEADPHVVVVNSFSKNFGLQGLRLGACLVPRHLAEAVVTIHQTILSSASSIGQHLVLDLIERGEISRMDYRVQRRMALEFVRHMNWQAHPPEGTFYVFPRVRNLDALRLAAAARTVYLLGGEAFGIAYGRHVRFCFGKPVDELERILAILADLAPDEG